jgi:tetratricopeptide (TPR) repeat protein
MASAEEAYLFAHIALRDAAYQLWLPSDRALLHAAALEILEALPEAGLVRLSAELAEHAHQAQQGVDAQRDARLLAGLREKEVTHLLRAVSAAEGRFQHDRVIDFCRRLLRSPALSGPDSISIELKLASTLQSNGKLDEAAKHFSKGFELAGKAGDGSKQSQALAGLGRVVNAQGNKVEAERLFEQAANTAEKAQDKANQSSAVSWLAGVYEDTGRAHLSEAMQLRAMELAAQSGNESIRLAAMGNLANHYRHVGRLEESVKTMRAVLEGFERLGDERLVSIALNNLARSLFFMGRLDEADAMYSRVLGLLTPSGQSFSLAFSLGNVAEIWLLRGKPRQATEALERALAICDETAALMHGAAFKARLAAMRLLMGERESAQELVEEARSDFIHSGCAQYIPDYCDNVRLRIAADAATDAAALAERKTSKINALAPRASWLPIMKQILGGMKKSLAAQKAGAIELKINVEAGEALLAEIEAAVRENRPARIFRGYRPEELTPELKAALAK